MTDPSHQALPTLARLASRRLLTHTIVHEGLTRSALFYMPAHVKRRGGVPLVLIFHGGASSPMAIAKKSAMHRLGEEKGFAVAYPTGTRGAAGLTWCPRDRAALRRSGDARFAHRLILDLQRSYEIDPMRIYAAGFSIGGALVYELACCLADRIAAIGVVGGTMTSGACHPSNPVPLIHIHGTRDRHVPLEGGRGPATSDKNDWPPVRSGIDQWRLINGCVQDPQIEQRAADVTTYRYSGVADVELWLLKGGGHTWPGAAGAPRRLAEGPGFSASEQIWRFFAAHPRRRVGALAFGTVEEGSSALR